MDNARPRDREVRRAVFQLPHAEDRDGLRMVQRDVAQFGLRRMPGGHESRSSNLLVPTLRGATWGLSQQPLAPVFLQDRSCLANRARGWLPRAVAVLDPGCLRFG